MSLKSIAKKKSSTKKTPSVPSVARPKVEAAALAVTDAARVMQEPLKAANAMARAVRDANAPMEAARKHADMMRAAMEPARALTDFAEQQQRIADAIRGPRGGKPADRVPLTVKVTHAQYRAIRMRAAETSSNVQEIVLGALVKLFEDDGLPFG